MHPMPYAPLSTLWGIRARRCEQKIKGLEDLRWVKKCWEEKRDKGWEDRYGKERERYYNNNDWSTTAIEILEREEESIENKLIGTDRDIQRQIEE